MSILKLLEQAQGGNGLAQLAKEFGLEGGQADGLTKMLAPALGSAAKKRVESGRGADLLGTLMGQSQGPMFDDAHVAASREGRVQGQNFLEQLLGGQAETEGLAQEAAERNGVDMSTVMKFLPALAAMVQGGLQKNMPDSSLESMRSGLMDSAQSGSAGIAGLVGSLMGGASKSAGGGLDDLFKMLDADGDGSPLDDILGKFMK
ncbi:MAG: DUF937 domain-containing protein [Pseudomonadota bacterium]